MPSVKTKPANLLEIAFGAGHVNLASGVIHNCKVCGLQSRNTARVLGVDREEFGDAVDAPYSYSHAALQNAIPLYEGVVVRIDHPATRIGRNGQRVAEQRGRSTHSTFGQLKRVHMKSDGIYADLHYLKSHKDAPFIVEQAQKMPTKIALSHNARGVPVLRNGRAVIDEILEVVSVDIVGDKAGTVDGLFENFHPTISKETKMQHAPELGTIDDTLVADPEVTGDLSADIRAIIDQLDIGDSEKLDQIADLVTAPEVLEDFRRLKGESHARDLLEQAHLPQRQAIVRALSSLRNEADRKSLVAELKESHVTRSRPRFSGRRVTEQHARQTPEEFARNLKRR